MAIVVMVMWMRYGLHSIASSWLLQRQLHFFLFYLIIIHPLSANSLNKETKTDSFEMSLDDLLHSLVSSGIQRAELPFSRLFFVSFLFALRHFICLPLNGRTLIGFFHTFPLAYEHELLCYFLLIAHILCCLFLLFFFVLLPCALRR